MHTENHTKERTSAYVNCFVLGGCKMDIWTAAQMGCANKITASVPRSMTCA
jgi:hypothetical protein